MSLEWVTSLLSSTGSFFLTISVPVLITTCVFLFLDSLINHIAIKESEEQLVLERTRRAAWIKKKFEVIEERLCRIEERFGPLEIRIRNLGMEGIAEPQPENRHKPFPSTIGAKL